MRTILFILLISSLSNCTAQEIDPKGTYELSVSGFRNAEKGRLEIAGEPGDYFGQLTIFASKRTRYFALGMSSLSADSMVFDLGENGYLKLGKHQDQWSGNFKYFGLKAELSGQKTDVVDEKMAALTTLKPQLPGFVSTQSSETFPAIDPLTKQLYFTRNGKIFSLDQEEGLVPFRYTLDGVNDSAPRFSPDGQTMIFTSNRNSDGSKSRKKNLWIAQRNSDNQWEAPRKLPAPVNIDSLGEYHAALGTAGEVYFVSYNRPGGRGRSDLYLAKPLDTNNYEIENLGPSINTENSEADVYIDPEKRFLLFVSTDRADSYGADDIYLSINQRGVWMPPVNLGPSVNSFAYEYGPWIDWESESLYFNSARRGSADIYKVPLEDIPALKAYRRPAISNNLLYERIKGQGQPTVIAPGIVSSSLGEYSPTYDALRNELLFMRRIPNNFEYTIMTTSLAHEGWSTPDTINFSGEYRDAAPYFSPDGNQLFFDSRRPHPLLGKNSIDLWSSKRTKEGWTTPQLLEGPSVNSPSEKEVDEYGPAIDGAGDLYFYSFRKPYRGGKSYFSPGPDYSTVTINGDLPDPSASTFIAYLYISPSGNLAIMEGRASGRRDTNLFYCRKDKNGNWSAMRE
ncbi:MAG: hypothetical protein AAF242_02540, partial [Bacteroidota bacterium]